MLLFDDNIKENLSMSETNEDYEDNQEEYDKVTTMEGNIPQCVRYIVQIIGLISW
ncbi:14884_t:CDS:2 [Entrophospora sp. SA101]|nr:14884_t:CDS:2 [Entrophospora sp. SA101]